MSDSTKYNSKLKGSKVLITGGSSGIGFCVAEALLESGATVIISSSSASRVETAMTRLLKSYPSAKDRLSGHACDLGTSSTLEQNVKKLFEKVGKLNHIVHTAGDALASMALQDASLERIEKAGMVRFFAPLIIAKYAAHYLPSDNKSSITLTTGTVSERPIPRWAIVNSYATGLHGMTRGLALDLAPIRVNLVSPGAVETELWQHLSKEEFNALKENFTKGSTTGKIGQPEEIAEAFLYLLKDTNCSGSVISTNGGALLK